MDVPTWRGEGMEFFIMGIFVTLTPSAVIMAWLLWQADDVDLDLERPN
jgi:hypothetical protein